MRSTETVVYVISEDLTEKRSLTELVLAHGVDVVLFDSATAYLGAKREDRTACLIVDLNLSDISALELQKRQADTEVPPVIFVTGHGDPASCVRAIKDGAVDVLLEPVDPRQLLASVELAFARDRRARSKRVERISLLALWRTLTPREKEVFHHTVAGLLNKQAAAELGVAENTYQVHRGRVMRKMEANSLADLVRMSMKLESILKNAHDGGRQILRPQTPPSQVQVRPLLGRALFYGGLNSRFGSYATSRGF